MADQTWPHSLPDWRLPTTDKADKGFLRTRMDAGPDKVRRRYSAVPSRFQTSIIVDGIQRYILDEFYHNTLGEGTLRFDRTDPARGGTQEFRFLDTPDYEQIKGGELPSERAYRVQLVIERMPAQKTDEFTVLLDGDYANELITFSRSSKAWYWGAEGLLKEAATDAMRFDHDPESGELLGLLIEESRTNEILDSRDMTTGNWSENNTDAGTRSRNEVGIDGISNTACTLTNTDSELVYRIDQEVTVVDDNATHVLSVFLKKESNNDVVIKSHLSGGSGIFQADTINLETGGVSGNGDGVVEDWGNWWRYYVMLTNDSSGNTLLRLRIEPDGTSSTRSVITDQAQVELNASFPTSPIITEGSAVTRSADVATVTDLSWYNQREGTFVANISRGAVNDISAILYAHDGSLDNAIYLYVNDGSINFNMRRGATTVLQLSGLISKGSHEIAISYKENDCALVVDGSVIDTSNSVSIPTGISAVNIGSNQEDNIQLNGFFNRLPYYPNRLANAKLQSLTS